MEDVLKAQVEGSTIEISLLRERMDAAGAAKFKEQLSAAWKTGLTSATIDMSKVEFIDSSGVGVLLGIYRSFPEGSMVTLKSMRPQVLSVIELLRLHRIFQIQQQRSAVDKPRFFPEQAAPLRAMLEGYLRELGASAAGLPGLSLLLLGGGYGRGEGGIMRLDGSEALYNDLEFYLLVDSPSAAHRDWIGRQSEIGHRTTGIEVEFKALPVSALRRARPSMFYYDLLAAHLPVAGDPGVLQTLPENLSDPAAIPADEGTRLLMNRGCSLLVCARMADGTEPGAPGFIDRIAAKLKLALGDAMLCSDGLYHWSCRERDRRLHDWKANIPHRDQILAWHREAVDFKFHPRASGLSDSGWRAPLRDLRAVWCDAFLWLEGKRLGMRLDSPVSYASTRRALLPHEHPIANALRRIRLGAANRRLLPGSWMRHPRENVLRSLALLINPDRTPEDIVQAARILGCDAASQPQPVEDACRNLWRQFP